MLDLWGVDVCWLALLQFVPPEVVSVASVFCPSVCLVVLGLAVVPSCCVGVWVWWACGLACRLGLCWVAGLLVVAVVVCLSWSV